MLALLLACALELAAAPADLAYTGRYADHPDLPALVEALEAGAADAVEDWPKWVAKEPPPFELRLRDRTGPPAEPWEFPGIGASDVEWDAAESVWALHFEVDVLLAWPDLARRLVLRQLILAATLAQRDGSPEHEHFMSPENPLVYAIASFAAGTMAPEVRWVSGHHHHSKPNLGKFDFDGLSDREEGDGGYVSSRSGVDFTFFALVLSVAPRGKDTKVGKLYGAVRDRQHLASALRRVTGKKLAKLEKPAREAWNDWLDDQDTDEEMGLVASSMIPQSMEMWPELVVLFEKPARAHLKAQEDLAASWTGAEVLFLMGYACAETGDERAEDTLRALVESSAPSVAVLYGALKLADLLIASGRADEARPILERALVRFGWQGEARATVEERLGRL